MKLLDSRCRTYKAVTFKSLPQSPSAPRLALGPRRAGHKLHHEPQTEEPRHALQNETLRNRSSTRTSTAARSSGRTVYAHFPLCLCTFLMTAWAVVTCTVANSSSLDSTSSPGRNRERSLLFLPPLHRSHRSSSDSASQITHCQCRLPRFPTSTSSRPCLQLRALMAASQWDRNASERENNPGFWLHKLIRPFSNQSAVSDYIEKCQK